MRILHLADLHLGKIFHDVHLTDDQEYLLDQAAALAQGERVDTVVIAGDVYDRAIPPAEATELLDRFLSRLVLEYGVRVVIIPGNHDSAERLSFCSRLLRERGVYIAADPFSCTPLTLTDSWGGVTLFPVPYIEPISLRQTVRDQEIPDFSAAYRYLFSRLPVTGRTVCIAHCYAAGGEGSESERPLAIGGASLVDVDIFSPFTLTLLGHLHRPQRVAETVWYAGAPLRYSFSELDHRKELAIYDIGADGTVTRSTFPVTPRRELRAVRGTLEEIIRMGESDPAREDYLSVTLTDRGALFDYGAKIREVYPNVLSIVREVRDGEGGIVSPGEVRRLTDLEIITRFYGYVGNDLEEERRGC